MFVNNHHHTHCKDFVDSVYQSGHLEVNYYYKEIRMFIINSNHQTKLQKQNEDNNNKKKRKKWRRKFLYLYDQHKKINLPLPFAICNILGSMEKKRKEPTS